MNDLYIRNQSGMKYPNCDRMDCPIWGPIHEHVHETDNLYYVKTQDRAAHAVWKHGSDDYGVVVITDPHKTIKQRVKEKIMGKKKDEKERAEYIRLREKFEIKDYAEKDVEFTQNVHNTFAEPAKAPQMLILEKVLPIDPYSKELPGVNIEVFAIRAGAIELVEPDTYAVKWEFEPEPERRISRFDMPPFFNHRYWTVSKTEPCVRITRANGEYCFVRGDLDSITQRVEAGSTD